MKQLEKYYVVRKTKKTDEEFAMIDAMTLDEARAIFEVRHKANKEAMIEGEAFYIFQANEMPMFDENHRLVFPKGSMSIIEKW
ncbi:hypothetical protein [Bacillus rubiinfantis]|uniref:hypothetical protein n=1 Tax=Bacillus rubiinfantis TaxID=1499680 RepID=UPI0005AAF986|nr:hypothetical protein [Bacillus rubiinfantis]